MKAALALASAGIALGLCFPWQDAPAPTPVSAPVPQAFTRAQRSLEIMPTRAHMERSEEPTLAATANGVAASTTVLRNVNGAANEVHATSKPSRPPRPGADDDPDAN